ncbi:MAG: hypothetical protein JW889_02065 [Verrucomicrobia bacterium]|nr:hypothetical protein [Verrucomicrobiota bacterium]
MKSPGPRADGQPAKTHVTAKEEKLAAELLVKTALFRESQAHPEWQRFSLEHLRIIPTSQETRPLYTSGPVLTGRQETAVRYFHADDGRTAFDVHTHPESGALLYYNSSDVLDALEEDTRIGRRPSRELTGEQAIERAKEYVRAAMGGIPKDLIVSDLRFPSNPPEPTDGSDGMQGRPISTDLLWLVAFRRYSGNIPYDWQGVEVSFSERYGVANYLNQYDAEWHGELSLDAEDAMRIARENIDAYLGGQLEVNVIHRVVRGGVVAVLQARPYVKQGRPFLMRVDPKNPSVLHAVWVVVLPCAQLAEDPESPDPTWWDVEAYVDGETGDFIAVRDPLRGETWTPE